jgi:glycerophosphoryl diester phosphodiesterase
VASLYPENTLPSFLAALQSGADGIELDIRLSKDNEVVVLHDPTLDRTTTGKGNVTEWTWKELQQLKAIKSNLGFNECFPLRATAFQDIPIQHTRVHEDPKLHPLAGPEEAPIPRLIDVFDMLLAYPRKDIKCIIDIKWDNPLAIMTHLNVILRLPKYKSLLSKLTLGIWSPHFLWSLPPREIPVKRSFIGSNAVLARFFSNFVENLSLDMELILKNPKLIRQFQLNGTTISAWTVDRRQDIQAIFNFGVDDVISDCVEHCVQYRDRFHQAGPESDANDIKHVGDQVVMTETSQANERHPRGAQ